MWNMVTLCITLWGLLTKIKVRFRKINLDAACIQSWKEEQLGNSEFWMKVIGMEPRVITVRRATRVR